MYMNDGNKTKINLRNKSVFITGVAGFIGSNLAKRLLSTVEGVKVVGLDNMNHYYDVRLKEARLNELEQFDNFSFVKGNLADKAVIESIFEQYKPEIVVNLGAQAGVRYSITNPDAYVEANLIGFYNILEACRHSYDEGHTPVEHLVYASSSSVYGSNKKVPYSTDDKVDNPVSLYAATKKSNELMAHQYGKINGLAIDKGIHMAYHPKQNGVVELQSLNFPKRAQFFVSAVPEEKQGDWADHLRGAAKMLGEKYRLKVGLSGIIEGSLPIGGLSSSASVIICFLSALCKVNGIHLEPMEMILTAKAAENQYVGVSCGKLDQSCEVLSKKNHLLYLDTKDDSYELIPTAIPKATKLFRNLR